MAEQHKNSTYESNSEPGSNFVRNPALDVSIVDHDGKRVDAHVVKVGTYSRPIKNAEILRQEESPQEQQS